MLMLILARVSILLLMGDRGIINRANDSSEKIKKQGYEVAEKDGKSYIKIRVGYYEIKLEEEQVNISKDKTDGISGVSTTETQKIWSKKYI